MQIRRQAYWAILSGAAGQVIGNRPIWLFDPGWQEALDSTGAQDMTRLRSLFLSRHWYDLVPDQKHEVVVSGLGEFNGLDYLAAARTADGKTVIVYMPTAREIEIDLTKIAAETAKTWWFRRRLGAGAGCRRFPLT